MTGMEQKIVRELNGNLNDSGIAYRLKQAKFTSQIIDILVDSKKHGYFGFECKSVMYNPKKPIYFSSNFTVNNKGEHQITLISDFLRKSGREGFIIIEQRKGKGNKNITHVVPWDYLNKVFNDNFVGITWGEIYEYGEIFEPSKLFK